MIRGRRGGGLGGRGGARGTGVRGRTAAVDEVDARARAGSGPGRVVDPDLDAVGTAGEQRCGRTRLPASGPGPARRRRRRARCQSVHRPPSRTRTCTRRAGRPLVIQLDGDEVEPAGASQLRRQRPPGPAPAGPRRSERCASAVPRRVRPGPRRRRDRRRGGRGRRRAAATGRGDAAGLAKVGSTTSAGVSAAVRARVAIGVRVSRRMRASVRGVVRVGRFPAHIGRRGRDWSATRTGESGDPASGSEGGAGRRAGTRRISSGRPRPRVGRGVGYWRWRDARAGQASPAASGWAGRRRHGASHRDRGVS